MIFPCLHSNANAGWRMRTHSQASGQYPRCAVSSATRRHVSSPLTGAQKNNLWRLRPSAFGVVRPKAQAGTRSVLRRHPRLSRVRGTARIVPTLRPREAREPGVSGRQPALHEALCLLRRTTLSERDDQGRGPGTQARLAHRQGPGEAIHGGSAGPCRPPGAEGHRHR